MLPKNLMTEIKALRRAKENSTKCFESHGCKPEANISKNPWYAWDSPVKSGVEKASAIPCTLITAFMLQAYIYRNTTLPRIARRNEIRVVALEYNAERDETGKVKQTIKNACGSRSRRSENESLMQSAGLYTRPRLNTNSR